ncbi:MAG TPA: hypothetical protein VG797_08645 [Phycisphaerales bacterium]|nr:hypothetical protein [Phycisphaerales bacterium]
MSVLLKGRNGNELELGFVRDSYAEVQDGTGDSAWTTVTVRAATNDDSWEESSPCMNIYEFNNLAEWLEAVGSGGVAGESGGAGGGTKHAHERSSAGAGSSRAGEGDVPEIELLEPDLKFSVSGQDKATVTIRVGFHLADRPEEFNVDSGPISSDPDTDDTDLRGDDTPPFIDIRIPRPSLLAAAEELRATLAELNVTTLKDDLDADNDAGIMGEPDSSMNMVDRITKRPPGAGTGEDNAGNR